MGLFTLKPANRSTSSPPQPASRSRCSSLRAERARDDLFCAVPGSVADAGTASQYTHVEVERRVNSATGARGSTLRREIGPGLTSKTSQVRNLLRMSAKTWKLMTFAVPVKGLDDKKIVQIASGQQHSIALDEDGYAHDSNLRKHELTVFPSQYCIRLGLQWLLSSGPWESKRRSNSASCSSGMSCLCVTPQCSCGVCSSQGHTSNFWVQKWSQVRQILW